MLTVARLLLTSALTAAGPAAGAAQAPVPDPADPFAGLVREALEHNRPLAMARLAQAGSEARLRAARARYLPTVDLDARWTEQSGGVDIGDFVNPAYAALNGLYGADRFPTDVSFRQPFRQDFRVRLVQPVFDPAIRAGHRAAAGERDAARHAAARHARELALRVQQAWLARAAAARSVEVLDAALVLLDENLRVAGRLVAAGLATPDAVSRARADHHEVTQRRAAAAQGRDAAGRALNQLLGRSLDAPADPLPDTALVRPLPLDRAAAEARARAAREEVAEAASQVAVARAGQAAAGAGFLPAVAVAGEYGLQGDRLRVAGDSDVALGAVVVRWNLFRGGADQARRDEARLAVERARLAEAEVLTAVTREAADAWDAAAVAAAALPAAAARLDAAERTFEVVRARYAEGLATHLEFAQARTELTRAGLDQVVARYSYAARRAELERAAAVRPIEP